MLWRFAPPQNQNPKMRFKFQTPQYTPFRLLSLSHFHPFYDKTELSTLNTLAHFFKKKVACLKKQQVHRIKIKELQDKKRARLIQTGLKSIRGLYLRNVRVKSKSFKSAFGTQLLYRKRYYKANAKQANNNKCDAVSHF